MKYEVARKEFITAEERAKEIFAEEISGSVSAVFTDTAKSSVLAVCGLKFYVPIAEKIAVLLETDACGRELMEKADCILIKYSLECQDFCTVVCEDGEKQNAVLSDNVVSEISELLISSEHWGGSINESGELECDLTSPIPGPNYYTNMLLGNRIGFGNVLQCTPKSVVDRLGRGSFRSHADTQVLAARWDHLPTENGFPANRQFYIVENGEVIFYSADPAGKNVKDGKCIHAKNHTVISYTLTCGLEIKRTIFLLPQKEKMPIACEAQMIEILNNSGRDRNVKLIYTGMFGNASSVCLKSDIIYYTVIEESNTICDDDGNLQAVSYHYNPEYEQGDLRFHTSVAHIGNNIVYPKEFCFNYLSLIGNGTLAHPDGAVRLDNKHVRKGPPFFAVSTPLFLKPGQNAQIDNLTCLTSEKDNNDYKGIKTMLDGVAEVNRFLQDSSALPSALKEVKEFTKRYNTFLKIKDQDKNFETYVNNNLPFQVYYQNFVSRSFDQTQKGYREIGFREIQDIFAAMYYWIGMGRADIVRDFICEWAVNVYDMGYANHNFFWQGKEAGVSSDDQLWLLQALDRYVSITGDYGFLKKRIATADGGERSLLDTIKAIITYSAKISVGKHGLPLLDAADWNDCLRVDLDWINGKTKEERYKQQLEAGGKYGDRFETEQSESVMNGFLLKVAVDSAANIFEKCGMFSDSEEMKKLSSELYERLQKHTWKGDFFCRVLFNRSDKPQLSYLGAGGDGLSANPDKNGTYYINSFSWSVLSGVATDEQIAIMLDSLEKYVKTPFGFQLSSEVAYDKIAERVSASNFFFGDRENGGIFKHANMMLAAALVKAANDVESSEFAKRLTDTAYWLIEKIVPYDAMRSPFTVCGNPRFCTQYNNADTGENIGPTLSGTSSWLLLTVTMLLGLHTTGGKIEFKPLLKIGETEKKITVSLNKTVYEITVKKPEGFFRVKDGNYSLIIDGEERNDINLPMFNDGLTHRVEMYYSK